MRLASFVALLLLACSLSAQKENTQGKRSQTPMQGKEVPETDTFATRREWSKGGVGLINKHLYAVVKYAKSDRNELVVKPTEETEESWQGKNVAQPEVAIFYDGKIWSPQALPSNFDLSRAVVVSFEGDKVRYFDFQVMFGGYYDRIWTED